MKNIRIIKTRKTYIRTKSRKTWSQAKKNITIETEEVTREYYDNFIDSISFFNNWGQGYSKGSWGYEYIGYVINRVVTVSPDREIKTIDTFEFEKVGI